MQSILKTVSNWRKEELPIALATVVQTWGSSPQGIGAKMAVNSRGQHTGSVSGGCVEGAVIEKGLEVLSTSRPALLHFGVSNEAAWEVGLACGGEIDVFIEPLDPAHWNLIREAYEENFQIGIATLVSGLQDFVGKKYVLTSKETLEVAPLSSPKTKQNPVLDSQLLASIKDELKNAVPGLRTIPGPQAAPIQIFFDVISARPTLVMVGGVHIAIPLGKIAHELGFQTVIVDPRKAFANAERFPEADRIERSWPRKALRDIGLTSNTAVAVLTHDPKIDDPALIAALQSEAFYIGALGSRKTQADRRDRLKSSGVTEADLARLRGPIGLNLGGRTMEEIALAIMAEVLAAKYGKLAGAPAQIPE